MMDSDKQLLKKDIVSGFKATGIFPFCPDMVLKKLPGFSPVVNNVTCRLFNICNDMVKQTKLKGKSED